MNALNQANNSNTVNMNLKMNLDAALDYINIGWRIFPVWPIRSGKCACDDPDCNSPGKHPIGHLVGDWRKGASVEKNLIQQWWEKFPDANIATPDFLCIDIDTKHNALEFWLELLMENGVPDTPHVFTPSGGQHWYFKPPDDWIHCNATGKLPQGIDVRGHLTGYTLLPPSNHLNGRYEWELSSSPDKIPVAPLPDWLAELLQPTQLTNISENRVEFSGNGNHKVDLAKLQLPELIRVTIERPPDKNTDRSAIDQSVISALIRAGANDDEVKYVFENFPIGTAGKYSEKGKNGNAYLAHSIAKARDAVFSNMIYVQARKKGEIVPAVSITESLPMVDLKYLEKCMSREELGDGELFAYLYNGSIVFDHSENSSNGWHLWDTHHWRKDDTGLIKPLFSNQLSEQYVMGAITLAKKYIAAKENNEHTILGKLEKNNELMSKRAQLLRRKSRTQNVLDYASSLLGISGNEWDAKSDLLPVANGVINLKTGKLTPGNPEDFLRTASPTKWKGLEESCPKFEQFLLEIMGKDASMVSYLQRLLGYGVSGFTSEHVFPIFWGETGRNGKDTLLETIGFILGPLAGAVSKDAILDAGNRRSGGAAEPHIYDLRGKRLVWASEPHEGARLDTAQVKLITGGGRLKARPLYGQYVEWSPTHLVILVTNPRPHAAADDKALWSRIQLVPFTQRFVDNPKESNEHKAEKNLKEELKDEASGILAWLVRGFLAWQKEGLNPPKAILNATDQYQSDEDTLGQFFDECCFISEDAQAGASQLVGAYQDWCEEYGIRNPMDGRTFGMKLSRRFERKHTRKGNVYTGVGLLA